MSAKRNITLAGEGLSLEDLRLAATGAAKVELSPSSLKKIDRSRKYVERLVDEGRVVYGITTGFGEFSSVHIEAPDAAALQRNLIVSHAAGCGEYYSREFVRAAMILRVNALAKGYSGITPATLGTLVAMINEDVVPRVPLHGSVGSSGDLVPLSHIVLAMMGEGETEYGGRKISAAAALKAAGIARAKLSYKEGLALINGTQMMTGVGALLCARAFELVKIANVVSALSTDALMGTPSAFNELISKVRPHRGQLECSRELTKLMSGSDIVKSHTECGEVQDAYSLRCIPQVHGAVLDSVRHVASVLETEMNSATDNPLVFAEEGEVISGGNFHGEPVALAMDFLGIALCELASISERRTDRLVNPNSNNGKLPAFLVEKGGLNSGFMIAQYTSASIVSENKVLAHPASVDSIPTSAGKEDFNSMGSIASKKCIRILENVEQVLAIELLAACQGLDFRKPVKTSPRLGRAYSFVRKKISHLVTDRIMHEDIKAAIGIIRSEEFAGLVRTLTR